ncbi:MAG: alpha/beta hydrolase [Ramlibacter sp.]|jgi:alpha-beta hydrolase superfamily lysophospholipase|nr:alpha/beta hydrolase [Ramlibacter sp.]
MSRDSTLSTFTASDGDNLAVQDWPLDDGQALRGVVVLVHGLGEHAGRYEHVARLLTGWGFAVRGYDQYGHGESGGVRGALTSPTRLLDDLADMVDSVRDRLPAGKPLILLGHSMGGLVAARFVSLRMRPVDGLILSSPALDPGLNAVQKLLLAVLPRIAPNLSVGNGLKVEYISHDPATVAAYKADPLVHDRISGRLARFIADEGPATVAAASRWSVPTLLMYAGGDRLVNPAGSRAFAAAAPPGAVTVQAFDDLYHELFNESEPGRLRVFAALHQWLNARFPA